MREGQSWEHYRQALIRSDQGVQAAAYWLWKLGYRLHVGKLQVAPSAEQAKYYGDRGDIHIWLDERWWEIDIKYYVLLLLAKLGIVWGLKQVQAYVLTEEGRR